VADVEIRAFAPDDVNPAYELLAEHQRELFGEAELTHGMFSNLIAISDFACVAETRAGLAGSAHHHADGADVLVRPSERRRGIGTRLLRAVEENANVDILRLDTVTLEPAAAAFCTANGYEKAWDFWLMGVDLDDPPEPVWPEGISVRTFSEADAVAVKALLDEAYAAEPHHTPLSIEHWRTFMLGDPSYDPSVWFLAVAGEEIVGAALNWKEGYVKDLVVHPDWRRRGLGKALMQQTFAEFACRGIPRVTLKVDSINPTQAWLLYEGLGMRKERTYEVFEKRLN
jgi:mycothiol synthase